MQPKKKKNTWLQIVVALKHKMELIIKIILNVQYFRK